MFTQFFAHNFILCPAGDFLGIARLVDSRWSLVFSLNIIKAIWVKVYEIASICS